MTRNAWSKDMKLDPYTFGKSRACEVVVAMMNENVIPVYEKHRVLAFILASNLYFKEISEVSNKRIIVKLMDLFKRDTLAKVEKMPYPDKFKSYLKNVISYIYKSNLKKAI